MNGLTYQTRVPSSPQHRVVPLTDDGRATAIPNMWPRTTAGVTPSAVARLLRAYHLPNGRWLLSRHGRVALRETTVPDPTWHGVSERGASEMMVPKPFTQRSLQCNPYSVNGQACSADLFAGHLVPLELKEEGGGLWIYLNNTEYTSRLQSAFAYRALGGLFSTSSVPPPHQTMILAIITILSYH